MRTMEMEKAGWGTMLMGFFSGEVSHNTPSGLELDSRRFEPLLREILKRTPYHQRTHLLSLLPQIEERIQFEFQELGKIGEEVSDLELRAIVHQAVESFLKEQGAHALNRRSIALFGFSMCIAAAPVLLSRHLDANGGPLLVASVAGMVGAIVTALSNPVIRPMISRAEKWAWGKHGVSVAPADKEYVKLYLGSRREMSELGLAGRSVETNAAFLVVTRIILHLSALRAIHERVSFETVLENSPQFLAGLVSDMHFRSPEISLSAKPFPDYVHLDFGRHFIPDRTSARKLVDRIMEEFRKSPAASSPELLDYFEEVLNEWFYEPMKRVASQNLMIPGV